MEHSKEVPLASKETTMQGAQHKKAFPSTRCAASMSAISFTVFQVSAGSSGGVL